MDQKYMRAALREAAKAALRAEVPIGAVIVQDERIIGRGHNQPIERNDPTAHAEVVALRQAARKLGNYRLTQATLYVTVEPCAMCAGAMVLARMKRLVYGANDAKAGGVVSIFRIADSPRLNHRVQIEGGMLEAECREILQRFFRTKRGRSGPLRIAKRTGLMSYDR
ncbi:MAG: tRNA adenosine(34) deaminase TadA [Acidobacteria bacterium]|nr:tRNA adenosine(34) deaminase TadA [Acidobacteriota bacterium]MBI3656640.1 tRNA adenosine(34) deaminase TadA [Acidobacteriota bacterium]